MRLGVVIAVTIGLALTAYLVLHLGIGSVFAAARSVGWGGFALICAFALALEVVLGSGWFALMPPSANVGLLTLVMSRQVRDSSADVLPFSQLGGMVIGARAAMLRGIAAPMAFASMLADVTTELMAQLGFVAIGLALCVERLRAAQSSSIGAVVIGLLLMVPAVAAFVFLQRRGSALANALAGRWLPGAVKHAAAFSAAMNEIYAARWRLAASSSVHLAGWLLSGLGTWIIIRLIGGRIDVLSAVAIEALLAGLRSATVFVPSAIGVQEAGYAGLAPLFGLPAEMGLAVSLLMRARSIAIGVPVLLAWQAAEGRHAFAREDAMEG